MVDILDALAARASWLYERPFDLEWASLQRDLDSFRDGTFLTSFAGPS